jgi:hypothetical protein
VLQTVEPITVGFAHVLLADQGHKCLHFSMRNGPMLNFRECWEPPLPIDRRLSASVTTGRWPIPAGGSYSTNEDEELGGQLSWVGVITDARPTVREPTRPHSRWTYCVNVARPRPERLGPLRPRLRALRRRRRWRWCRGGGCQTQLGEPLLLLLFEPAEVSQMRYIPLPGINSLHDDP